MQVFKIITCITLIGSWKWNFPMTWSVGRWVSWSVSWSVTFPKRAGNSTSMLLLEHTCYCVTLIDGILALLDATNATDEAFSTNKNWQSEGIVTCMLLGTLKVLHTSSMFLCRILMVCRTTLDSLCWRTTFNSISMWRCNYSWDHSMVIIT